MNNNIDDTKDDGCGLREHIDIARSAQSINELLVIGTQFEQASPKTQRAWLATAKRRCAELELDAGQASQSAALKRGKTCPPAGPLNKQNKHAT